MILGDDGIGKTCTLEQLENETTDIGQIRIDGNPMLSIDQLHASFLQQLNNYEQTVEYNSVRDSLLRASEISEQLIIVDDAHESLISLVSPIEQSPTVPVRLFLFGNLDLKQQLKLESFPQTAVYCMELKGFSKDEIPYFLGHQLNLSEDELGESFDNRSLSHIWKESHGNPGKIIRCLVSEDIELEDVEDNNRSVLPAIIFRTILALLGIALLLLALFGEKWFGDKWLQSNDPADKQNNQANAVEVELPNQDQTQPQQLKPQQVAPKIEQIEESTVSQKLALEQQPPLEIENVVEAATQASTQTNNESTPLEAAKLPEENASGIDLTAAEIVSAVPDKPVVINQNIDAEKELQKLTPEVRQISNSLAVSDYTANEKYLMLQPRDHYSIQLVGLSNFQEIEKYAKQLNASESLYIYRSLLNGKPWYILVMGNYPDAVTARAAKDKLNSQLKKLNPWIKSFTKIQHEIKLAADSR